jgi:hypothetical protein
MTNETEYKILLQYNHISHQFTKYMGVILYILCLFGTVMNILTFMQRKYNSRVCTLYLLIASICDFIHLNFGPLSNILQYGFHYDSTMNSIIYCKSKSYLVYIFTVMSASFTTLASIDRYVLSSRKITRWKFSTRSIAIRCILFITLFWLIVAIPIVFCYTRFNHYSHNEQLICSNPSRCIPCLLIQIFYTCIFNGFLPPLAMIYFGCITCLNARQLHQRSKTNSARTQQINHQLTLMLVLQSIKSSFASLPFAIFNCYLLITLNIQKSALFQAKENLVNQIVYLLFWSNYTSFFVYMSSSDIFRNQCLKAIKRLVCYKPRRYYDHVELKHLTTATNIFEEKYKSKQIL